MNANAIFRRLGLDRHLAIEFFAFFSRFEHALKASTYFKEKQNGVLPDWDRFARDNAPHFVAGRTYELQNAVEYLCSNPPKKQIVTNGLLDWKDVDVRTVSLEQAIDSIKRVRNNLFHGGKFAVGSVENSNRNKLLLESSIVVLKEALTLDRNVESNFNC